MMRNVRYPRSRHKRTSNILACDRVHNARRIQSNKDSMFEPTSLDSPSVGSSRSSCQYFHSEKKICAGDLEYFLSDFAVCLCVYHFADNWFFLCRLMKFSCSTFLFDFSEMIRLLMTTNN